MPMPVVLTAAGTSTSAIWTPDWMQNPFSVGMAAYSPQGAGFKIEATYDNLDVSSNLGGVASFTAGNATWITVVAVGAATVTAAFTSPVTGLRINIVSAGSVASTVSATFIQATFPR